MRVFHKRKVVGGLTERWAAYTKGSPTQRAPDKWESARFMSSFLALSLFLLSNRVHIRPLADNAIRQVENNRD